jgi:hypothetical protein
LNPAIRNENPGFVNLNLAGAPFRWRSGFSLCLKRNKLKLELQPAAGITQACTGGGNGQSSPTMKFALAILVYLVIAAILVAFVVAFGRIGCMPH